MIFSSSLFLFLYLPIVLLIYYVINIKYRNIFLFFANLIFYGWGEPIYILIMAFSTIVDYVNGYYVGKYRDTNIKKARVFLILSIVINLSLLGFFKYYDFLVTSFSFLGLKPLGLGLPIGISFYTFQTMSYSIDIYRNQAKVQKNIFTFGTYVALFPQLIAGPIVRYKDLSDQLDDRPYTVDKFSEGVNRFMIGLAKKILLANGIGQLWDSVIALPASQVSVLASWLGIIGFAFQIYFDFSGYSDMAIGLGKMLGFEFLENFNYPYISKSITEFWRRWHISLGTWFREYVYIPLGGNRKSLFRNIINLFIVWFLTGLWHGADYNFILWGLYFWFILLVEKYVIGKYLKKMPNFIQHFYALFLILIGWVIFQITDLNMMKEYLKTLFGINTALFNGVSLELLRNYFILLVVCGCSSVNYFSDQLKIMMMKHQWLKVVALVVGLVVITSYLVDATYNPFLYFRF
ncbi:MAG: MBOAT family O-acyltransferase [Erysipelotrichaceae bacterium]